MQIVNNKTNISPCHNCGTTAHIPNKTQKGNAAKSALKKSNVAFFGTQSAGTAQPSNKTLPQGQQCPNGGGLLYQYAAFIYGTAQDGNGTPLWLSPILPYNQAQAALWAFLHPQNGAATGTYDVWQYSYCAAGSTTATANNSFTLGCDDTPPPPPPPACQGNAAAVLINGEWYCPCECDSKNCPIDFGCQEYLDNCYCAPICPADLCWNFYTHRCDNCPCATTDCSTIVCADGKPATCINGVCLCACDCNAPQCQSDFVCRTNPDDNDCYCVPPCPIGKCYNFSTNQCEDCPCTTNNDCSTVVCPNGNPAECVNGVCLCTCNCNAPNCPIGDDCVINPANGNCYCVTACPAGQCYNFITNQCELCPCTTGNDCSTVVCANGDPAECVNGVCLCPCDCNAPECTPGYDCQDNNGNCYCVPCGIGLCYDFANNVCEPCSCPNDDTPIQVGNNYYCPCDCDAPTQCNPLTHTCTPNPLNANECICVPICEGNGVFNPLTGTCETPCDSVPIQLNYTLHDGYIELPTFPVVNGVTNEYASSFILTATNTGDPSISPIIWNYPPDASSPLSGPPYYIPLASGISGNWTIIVSNIVLPSLDCAIADITLSLTDVGTGTCCTPVSFNGFYSPTELYYDYKINKSDNGNGYTRAAVNFWTVVEPDRISAYLLDTLTGNKVLLSRSPFTGKYSEKSCQGSPSLYPPGSLIADSEFTQGYWHNANDVGNSLTPFEYDNTNGNIGNTTANIVTGGNAPLPSGLSSIFGNQFGSGTLYFDVANAEFDGNDEATIRIGVLPHRCRKSTVWFIQPTCEVVNCTTCGVTLPADQCTPIDCKGEIEVCDAYQYRYTLSSADQPATVQSITINIGGTITTYLAPPLLQLSNAPADIAAFNLWADTIVPLETALVRATQTPDLLNDDVNIDIFRCFDQNIIPIITIDFAPTLGSQFLLIITGVYVTNKLKAISPAPYQTLLWIYYNSDWNLQPDPSSETVYVRQKVATPNDILLEMDVLVCGRVQGQFP